MVRTQEPGSPKARGRPLASRTDFFKIGARPSVGSARAMAAEAEPEPESEERQLAFQAYQGAALTREKCALACAYWCSDKPPVRPLLLYSQILARLQLCYRLFP